MKNVRIRSYSGPYFPAIELNTESECGKIRTRITPNMNTFYAAICTQKMSVNALLHYLFASIRKMFVLDQLLLYFFYFEPYFMHEICLKTAKNLLSWLGPNYDIKGAKLHHHSTNSVAAGKWCRYNTLIYHNRALTLQTNTKDRVN